MVVGELAEPVDLVVIGGGPGGYVAALRAAELGREVTLVDRGGAEGGLGGACLHVGCIPSKALIELADAYERTRAMAPAGLRVDGARVDLAEFQRWKAGIVERLARGVRMLLDGAGVRRVDGQARFVRPDRLAVELADGNVSFLEFRNAIVATGSRPQALPSLPFDGERVLSSSDFLALEALPDQVVVVGAGYIGLELGTAVAKLGTAVTVVEATDRILPTLDAALTRPLARRLDALGVEVRLERLVEGMAEDELTTAGPDGPERLPAELVAVAVGRVPNTDDLGLDRAGVEVDERGLVLVDDRRLATPHIAAIGDVTAGPPLAHKASAEAIVAADALCGRAAAFDPMAIPAVVFTDPELASVGLSEAEARAQGLDVVSASASLVGNGRAATLLAEEGSTRVVIERGSDRVVGVQIVGPHASELIAEAALAIELIAAPHDVLGTVHPHPTLSEGLHAAVARAVGGERAD